jgi:hypothetical protein
MGKFEEIFFRHETVIAWVVFAVCGIAAFTGLAIGHKEIIAVAFAGLLVFLAVYTALTFAATYRMRARIREASKRTAADMA